MENFRQNVMVSLKMMNFNMLSQESINKDQGLTDERDPRT